MKKVLIIGKRGFLGKNLYKYLKRGNSVNLKSFNQIKNYNDLKNYNFIINTSINRNYIKKKYQEKFDNDFKIVDLIKKNIKYIFISTRKVYKLKNNIKENSEKKPTCFYSKNKLITEKKLNQKLGKNLIILRVSNIIGEKKETKNLHYTFIDHFISNIKKGYIYNNTDQYKDFISIEKFCQIINQILKKNLNGIYNVSIGEKIFLNELVSWLNKYNRRKNLKKKKMNNRIKDNFYLNNKKLMNKIKISNNKSELKNYCYKLSKSIFC